MARDSDKLTFNTLHITQETLLSFSVYVTCLLCWKMYLQSLDFAPLFKNVFDMNTFVLIF